MTVLLQNRTISMILMVPDVELLPRSSSSPIIEKLDRSDLNKSFSSSQHDHQSNIDTTSSMPVYHGSIVRIEQHEDDQNTSDLIVRVPNFQGLLLPSNDTDSKQPTRIKRRAPICPVLNDSNPRNNPDLSYTNNRHLNLTQSRVTNPSRLATGLRSLSRAFTHGCKSKRSSSINEIKYPPALPDIEVMKEKLQAPTSSRKNIKHQYSTATMPKLLTPKILFTKRKHSKIKKKQPSSSIESTRINPTTQYAEITKTTSFCQPLFIQENDLNQDTNSIQDDDDDKEQQNESMRLSFEVEQHFAAISQLISDLPVSSIDADSLSTHRYSTISAVVPDIPNSITDTSPPEQPSVKFDRPFRVQTSILQPDISVVRVGTNDLTTGIDRLLPGENPSNEQKNDNPIDEGCQDETYAECYQVTYQIDSQQTTVNLDPWLSPITPNEYEQVETIPKEQGILINNITRVKSRSVDDLSRTSNDQSSSYQPESISAASSSEIFSRHCTLQQSNSYNGFGIYVSTDMKTRREHFIREVEELSPGDQAGLKENDRILCINGTPVIDEDYTVVLQLIKHGLQADTLDFDVIANEAYEQFKSQIDQLYQ